MRGTSSTLWRVDCLFLLAMHPALQAKKGNQPPKASNLSLTVLRRPIPDGPNSFCSGCGAPWGTHNALTSTRTPHWQISTLEMPSVSRFSLYLLVHPVGRVKTSALLTDGISSVEICQWGVRVVVRALCVPQGAAQPRQKAPKNWHRKTLGEYPALTPRYCFCLLPSPPRVNGPGHVSSFERGGPLARGAMFLLSKGGVH